MLIQPRSHLLFIGDSITAAQRSDAGEVTPHDPWNGLGRGYVSQVEALITSRHPESFIRVSNRGVSGNTVVDLMQRWQRDVVALKPNWLSVFIGINDVWRHFDCPTRSDIFVPVDVFEMTYTKILDQTRKSLDGLVLFTPFVIEEDPEDAMRLMMSEYAAVVETLADRFDALLVDSQSAFGPMLEWRHPTSIAWDRIHLGLAGHMCLARSFLDAVGFEW